VLIRFQGLPVWDRVLHAATTPTAALFLILLGAFGFVFETYNPGIGIAAALGFVLLALGFYALDVLPTNWWALLIITASLVALIYDVHVAGFGPFTVGGLIGVALGSALLFPGGVAALDVHLFAIVAAVLLTILFFVSVMTAALRVRLRRPIDDSDGIVGSIAEAHTDIAPEGTVMSNGTLWRARTMETGIAAGARVQVKATEGLVLLVEPLHEE
jgi:membrane-bound serine protease (ClpP class)